MRFGDDEWGKWIEVFTIPKKFWERAGELNATDRETGEIYFERPWDEKRTLSMFDDGDVSGTSKLGKIIKNCRQANHENMIIVVSSHAWTGRRGTDMGIGPAVRDQIKEVIGLEGIMHSTIFDQMDAEHKIPGMQTKKIKREVLERVGFQQPRDVAYFNSKYLCAFDWIGHC